MNIAISAEKERLLSEFDERMSHDCRCQLKHAAQRPVPGKGIATAEILFIGEAPGAKEDERGEPFVGASGRFLDELLASIGLSREAVYITNIVKYRPPENRDPTPEEIRDCSEWLEGQINIIHPKLIVTLGRHALHHFFPDRNIADAHGKTFLREFPAGEIRRFYALYHPAAALHNGGMRDTIRKDFLRIPDVIKTILRSSHSPQRKADSSDILC